MTRRPTPPVAAPIIISNTWGGGGGFFSFGYLEIRRKSKTGQGAAQQPQDIFQARVVVGPLFRPFEQLNLQFWIFSFRADGECNADTGRAELGCYLCATDVAQLSE